jgi:hypothetical protein
MDSLTTLIKLVDDTITSVGQLSLTDPITPVVNYENIENKIIRIGKDLQRINDKMYNQNKTNDFIFSDLYDDLVIDANKLAGSDTNEIKYTLQKAQNAPIMKISEEGTVEIKAIMDKTDKINDDLLQFYRVVEEFMKGDPFSESFENVIIAKKNMVDQLDKNKIVLETSKEKMKKIIKGMNTIYNKMDKILNYDANKIDLFNVNYAKYSDYYIMASNFAHSMILNEKKICTSNDDKDKLFVDFIKDGRSNSSLKFTYNKATHVYDSPAVQKNILKSTSLLNKFDSTPYDNIKKQAENLSFFKEDMTNDENKLKSKYEDEKGAMKNETAVEKFIKDNFQLYYAYNINKKKLIELYLKLLNGLSNDDLILQYLTEFKYNNADINTIIPYIETHEATFKKNIAMVIILLYICSAYNESYNEAYRLYDIELGDNKYPINIITQIFDAHRQNYELFYIHYNLSTRTPQSVARYNIMYNILMIYYYAVQWELCEMYYEDAKNIINLNASLNNINFHRFHIGNIPNADYDLTKNEYPTEVEINKLINFLKGDIKANDPFGIRLNRIVYSSRVINIDYCLKLALATIEKVREPLQYMYGTNSVTKINDVNNKIINILNKINKAESINFIPNAFMKYEPLYAWEYVNYGRMLMSLEGSIEERKLLDNEFKDDEVFKKILITNPRQLFNKKNPFRETKQNTRIFQIFREIYEKSDSLASLILNIEVNKDQKDVNEMLKDWKYQHNIIPLNRFMIPNKLDDVAINSQKQKTFFDHNHEIKIIFDNNKTCKSRKHDTFQYNKTLLGEHEDFLSKKIVLHDKISNISRLYLTEEVDSGKNKIVIDRAQLEKHIVNPNFDELDNMFQRGGKVHNKKSRMHYSNNILHGGHINMLDNSTIQLINEHKNLIIDHKDMIIEYNINAEKINKMYASWMYHYKFLNKINGEKLINTGNVIYENMNVGIIIYYSRILTSLVEKMDLGSPLTEIKYFKMEHYVTVKLLDKFFKELLKCTSQSFIAIKENYEFNEELLGAINALAPANKTRDNISKKIAKITTSKIDSLFGVAAVTAFKNNIKLDFETLKPRIEFVAGTLPPLFIEVKHKAESLDKIYNDRYLFSYYDKMIYSYMKELLSTLNEISKAYQHEIFTKIIQNPLPLFIDNKFDIGHVHFAMISVDSSTKESRLTHFMKDLIKSKYAVNIIKTSVNMNIEQTIGGVTTEKPSKINEMLLGNCEGYYKQHSETLYFIWDNVNNILKDISEDKYSSNALDKYVKNKYDGVNTKQFYGAVLDMKAMVNTHFNYFFQTNRYFKDLKISTAGPVLGYVDKALPFLGLFNGLMSFRMHMGTKFFTYYDVQTSDFTTIHNILLNYINKYILKIIEEIETGFRTIQQGRNPDFSMMGPPAARAIAWNEKKIDLGVEEDYKHTAPTGEFRTIHGDIKTVSQTHGIWNKDTSNHTPKPIWKETLPIAIMLALYENLNTYDQRKYYFATSVMDNSYILRFMKDMFMIPFTLITEIMKTPKPIIEKIITSNCSNKSIKLLTESFNKVIDCGDRLNRLITYGDTYISKIDKLLVEVNNAYKYYVYALPLHKRIEYADSNIDNVIDSTFIMIDGIKTTILPYSQQIIDIDSCGVNAKKYFIIFNSFKKILDAYDVSIKGEISIIGRINDGVLKGADEYIPTNKKTFIVRDKDKSSLIVNHGFVDDKVDRYDKLDSQTQQNIQVNLSNGEQQEKIKDLIKDEKKVNGLLIKSEYNTISNKYQVLGNAPITDPMVQYNKQNYSVINFTDVIDTSSVESNVVLEKYLGISSKLNKGTSVMIPTLGYSGTGKTFTLFGSYIENPPPKAPTINEGILHAVIQNLEGLKSCQFRMYELYGKGIPYFFYFNKPIDEIDHKVFAYKLDFKNKMELKGDNPRVQIDAKHISDYCSRTPGRLKKALSSNASYKELDFIEIKSKDINNFINTFVTLVEKVDIARKTGTPKTICPTPNNPESSRSILVYDFLFEIRDMKPVSFVIIDLPGREELVISYGENYLKLYDGINVIVGRPSASPRQVLLAKSLSVSPLYLCVMVPGLVLKTFNKESKDDKKKLLDSSIENKYHCSTYVYEQLPADNPLLKLLNKVKNGVTPYMYENKTPHFEGTLEGSKCIIDYTPPTPLKPSYKLDAIKTSKFLDEIYSMDATGSFLQINKIASLDTNFNVSMISTDISDNRILFTINQCVTIALHLINRIADKNRFDILERICKEIADRKFNDHMLNTVLPQLKATPALMRNVMLYFRTERIEYILKYPDTFFGPLQLKVLSDPTIDPTILTATTNPSLSDYKISFEAFFRDNCLFSYIQTPWEGVYINENIMGLLNYFVVEKVDKAPVLKTINKQDEKLNFHIQKAMMQKLCFRYYYPPGANTLPIHSPLEPPIVTSEIKLDEVLDYTGANKIRIRDLNNEFNYWGDSKFTIMKNIDEGYKSDYIFKKNEGGSSGTSTLIEEMLKPYFKSEFSYQYCIFYLMTNESKKVKPQINLLIKSQNIIEAIVKNS